MHYYQYMSESDAALAQYMLLSHVALATHVEVTCSIESTCQSLMPVIFEGVDAVGGELLAGVRNWIE